MIEKLDYQESYWSKLRRGFRECRPGFTLKLCSFEGGFSFDLFGFFIPLTCLDRWHREPVEPMDSWGFDLIYRSLMLNWGEYCRVIDLPWAWEQVRDEVWTTEGWKPFIGSWETGRKDGRQLLHFAYEYILRSGVRQIRVATVHTRRREHRWRMLKWSPYPSLKSQSIEVQFDDEIGERVGSWKGGTVGCGYYMLPGETAEQTLRRMESEREFR